MEGINWDADNNDLDYELWSAQEKALDSIRSGDYHITNFRAGFRGGKSVLGARSIILLASQFQETRYLVIGDSFQEAWNSTFRILFEQFPEADGEDNIEESPLVEDYSRKEKTITLKNGSKIVLGSAQKADRHKGDEYSAIWADEVAFFRDLYDLTKMLLSRLSADKGPLQMIWTTTTNGYNDYYKITEEGIVPESEEEHGWKIDTIVADSRNNPFLTDDALQHAIEINNASEIEGLAGGFAPAEGRVYEKFNRNTHVISYDEIEDKLVDKWRIYGVDLGWNDPKICIEIGKTSYGQLVVLNEYYESEAYITDMIQELQDKPSGHLYTDYNYKDDVQKMRDKLDDIVVKKANKSIDSGIQEVRQRLEQDDNDKAGLLVCESCTNTIQEFLSYTKSDVGGNNADDHCLDSIRYAINSPQQSIMSSNNTESGGNTVINTVNNPKSNRSNGRGKGRGRSR